MDLTTYTTPIVRYYRWFANGGGSGNPNDSLLVRLDNGSQTVTVRRVFGLFANSWNLDSFSVAGVIPVTSTMHVTFHAQDYPGGHVTEAAVDGFEVAISKPRHGDALLTIAPNPMTDHTMVHYSLAAIDAPATFVLTDLLGKVVYAQPLSQSAGQFELRVQVPQGLYIGSIEQDGKNVVSMRVVR
jgi:hypothetical protein